MRSVLQRVKQASVKVDGQIISEIGQGVLIFVGVGKQDTTQDADYLINKIIQLRMFEDENGKMNLSGLEIKAEFLVVSQFTLYGDCEKGRRPSFDKAADHRTGEQIYRYFVDGLRSKGVKVATGQFRAMMDVALINDGPVTFVLESKKSEG